MPCASYTSAVGRIRLVCEASCVSVDQCRMRGHPSTTRTGARRATRFTRTPRSSASSRSRSPRPSLSFSTPRCVSPRADWRRRCCPCPDGSGGDRGGARSATHEAVVEHTDGAERRVPLTPDRSVGEVTRALLDSGRDLGGSGRDRPDAAGGGVDRAARPGRGARELRHRPGQLVLRRGNSGRAHARRVPRPVPRPVDPRQRVVGVVRPGRQPVLGQARPAAGKRLPVPQRDGLRGGRRRLVAGRWALRQRRRSTPTRTRRATVSRTRRSPPARWDATLGEYILDWDDVRSSPDPRAVALDFAHSAFRHACAVCGWDRALAASAEGTPPPLA